jgi:hypothetical protein
MAQSNPNQSNPNQSNPNQSNPIESAETELAIQRMLSDRTDQVVDVAIAARKAVLKAAKKSVKAGCSELIYDSYCVSDCFSFSAKLGQAFIHIATYANHVNLGFNFGAQLDDPDEILSGDGKLIRHIRLNSVADLRKKSTKDMIARSIVLGKKMAQEKNGIQPPVVIFNRPKTKKRK